MAYKWPINEHYKFVFVEFYGNKGLYMGKYSIKELESLSGIKAHTLRIWEKRYNLVSPERTETNIRFYSDEDLRKILNVSLLTNSGKKISEIASFSDDELCKAVLEINDEQVLNLKRVNQLIVAMSDFNEVGFHDLYDTFVGELGFEKTFTEVIHPYLEKVGILWLSGEIQATQEHMVTNLIRSKLICAIENLEYPTKAKQSALLFLPEGEFHELGLLFFNYLLRKSGIKVYYLGQSTPIRQTVDLINSFKPKYILTYSIVKSKNEVEDFLTTLGESRAGQIIYVQNKHQSYMDIEYPDYISKVSGYKEIMDLVKT